MISIVIPSLNQGSFLEDTLASVIPQLAEEDELRVMDGGSTDDTVSILKRYPRINYWISQPDGGQYAAISKGFAHGGGTLLSWLNAGDILFPWTLETVRSIFRECPEVQCLVPGIKAELDVRGQLATVGGRRLPGVTREGFAEGRYAKLGPAHRRLGYIQQEGSFWRRSLWEAAGGTVPNGYQFAGDFALWGRFLEQTDIWMVELPLGAIRAHLPRRSADPRYREEVAAALEEHRRRVGWNASRLRQLAHRLRLDSIPGLRQWLTARYGVPLPLVQRESRESDPRWRAVYRTLF